MKGRKDIIETLARAESSAVTIAATGILCYIITYLMTMYFVDCLFFEFQ